MQVFDIDLKTEFSALKKMSGGILRCYIPEVSSEADPDTQRPSVLICPGGAYVFCSNREAEPIALYYLSKGYNAFVLFYSVAPAKYPEPQVQAMAAIELIRKNRSIWHCSDKVCCMGFSAGGHLAACTANADTELARSCGLTDVRPDACILCYPLITSGQYGHALSFDSLCSSPQQKAALSAEKLVSRNTPPTFLWHTADDSCVPVQNSLLYASALCEHGVPFEMHIFPHGEHGLARCDGSTSIQGTMISPACGVWLELSVRWLERLSFGGGCV